MVTYLWIQPSKMMLKIQWKFKSVNTYHTRNVIPAQNVTFVLKFKDLRVLRTHFIEDIWDCRDELVSFAWIGTEKFRSRIKTVHGKLISWFWSKIILKTLGDNITPITLSLPGCPLTLPRQASLFINSVFWAKYYILCWINTHNNSTSQCVTVT